MKTLLSLLLLSLPAFGQLTTVSGTLYLPNGTTYNGQITCSWPVPFVGGDGRIMPAGPTVATTVKNGVLSIVLEANDTATPTGTFYTCIYRPTGSNSISETWIVPYSASPVSLTSVRQPATPATPSFAGITSLNGLTPVTQLFARVNDTNVTLSIGSAVSTHTFTMGWTGLLAAARGGTGFNSSSSTGVPRVTSGTWNFDAAASNLSGWPAGVDMTEVGYLDGVTSAIQTQLNAKAATSALSGYLPITGGALHAVSGYTQLTIQPGPVQGQNSQIVVFNTFGTIGTQFDGDGVLNTFNTAGDVKKASFYGGQVLQASDVGIYWKDQASIDSAGTFDIGFNRLSAGVLSINTGASPTTYASVKLLYPVFTATTASDTLLDNSQCTMLLTSNTNVQVRCKGSDSIVRHGDISIAP